MKVTIAEFAIGELQNIHGYYKENVSKRIADKIILKILDGIDRIETAPSIGMIEQELKELKLNHRYIVVGNYKIIFRHDVEQIIVTDIFDTRQNPEKIKLRSK